MVTTQIVKIPKDATYQNIVLQSNDSFIERDQVMKLKFDFHSKKPIINSGKWRNITDYILVRSHKRQKNS